MSPFHLLNLLCFIYENVQSLSLQYLTASLPQKISVMLYYVTCQVYCLFGMVILCDILLGGIYMPLTYSINTTEIFTEVYYI